MGFGDRILSFLFSPHVLGWKDRLNQGDQSDVILSELRFDGKATSNSEKAKVLNFVFYEIVYFTVWRGYKYIADMNTKF